MSFEFFGSDISFSNVDQVDQLCEFYKKVRGPVSCSSSVKLEVPLQEDVSSPALVEKSSSPVQSIKKPRFHIVYGPFKKSKKETSFKAAKNAVKKEKSMGSHPYKNGVQTISRQAATKEKSAFTYHNMIFLALENAPNKQGYVSDIYEFLIYNFPFFATAPKSWKNCVRNNISNSHMFEKTSEPTNKYKGDLWKVKAESYGKLLEGVKKTISKYNVEELKLREDVDLDDILAGRAVAKPSPLPKLSSPPSNVPVQTQEQQPIRTQAPPTVPFFPPVQFPTMPFPVYFNNPQFQHHQYPYYFNYNH